MPKRNLNELHDLVYQKVDMSPKSPAYTYILIILGLILLYFVIKKALLWQANKYKRLALDELKEIELNEVDKLNSILKRTAIQAYGRELVASLDGEYWGEFLAQKAKMKKDDFQILSHCLYNPKALKKLENKDFDQLHKKVRTWIIKHPSPLEQGDSKC